MPNVRDFTNFECHVFTLLRVSVILYNVSTEKQKGEKKAPLELLYKIANDENTPMTLRMDAMKALLPYTAKKTSETIETVNRTYTVQDERLKALTNEQLNSLLELIRHISAPAGVEGQSSSVTDVRNPGSGDESQEVQSL
jgi:hypothetical protein